MRIPPLLLSAFALLTACSAEEALAPNPDSSRLIGAYDWVSSSFSVGGPQIVQTPESTGESRVIVFTADSLITIRDSERERAEAYTSLGEVAMAGYEGLAVELSSLNDGKVWRYVLATELQADGTLVVYPLDPMCTEGCRDVYARIEE